MILKLPIVIVIDYDILMKSIESTTLAEEAWLQTGNVLIQELMEKGERSKVRRV